MKKQKEKYESSISRLTGKEYTATSELQGAITKISACFLEALKCLWKSQTNKQRSDLNVESFGSMQISFNEVSRRCNGKTRVRVSY